MNGFFEKIWSLVKSLMGVVKSAIMRGISATRGKLSSLGTQKKVRLKEIAFSVGAFVLFFGFFMLLISGGQLREKADVVQGEKSPSEFLAPYDATVDRHLKYERERKNAEDRVESVYKADDNAINRLQRNLDDVFNRIREAESLDLPEQRIAALRTNAALSSDTIVVFEKLDNDNLLTLFVDADFGRVRSLCTRAVVSVAENPVSGAKKREEIAAMGVIIREEINKLQIPDAYLVLMDNFVTLKVTEATLVIDDVKTKEARDLALSQVVPETEFYNKNRKIVGEGEVVTEDIYEVLAAFNLIKRESNTWALVGNALVTLLGMILVLFFLYRFQKELFVRRNQLILIGIMMTLVLGFARGVLSISLGAQSVADLLIFLIPVAWLSMTLTILLGEYVALASSVLIVFYMLMMVDPSNAGLRPFLLVFLSIVGSFGGIISVSVLKQRTDLARSGLYLAGINVVSVLCLCLVLNLSWQAATVYTLVMVVNGFLSSILMIGMLPLLERAFGITSSVRLLELADPNNPLLKQLLVDAPGTYHHSVMVGNLAEAAAEQVGANPLLVRVGAMYHDIGKLKRPYFFIENQLGAENPHDKITPTLSALIIVSHVKDGLELAEKHKLPEWIKNIIREHHGNSRANYFYIKALTDNPDTDEKAFRYGGPNPMSKESAIVLLADNVEAVIRSHRGNTTGRLNALVYKIIQDKADEGLLSGSELTFKDLSVIAAAFVKVLSGVFHSRVAYPEMPKTKSRDTHKKQVVQAKGSRQESKRHRIAEAEQADSELSEDKGIQGDEEDKGVRGHKGEGIHRSERVSVSDEFAKTVYMTGSRFSMDDNQDRSNQRGIGSGSRLRKPKKQNQTRPTKRQLKKKG
ncbi:MAG: HDIG domain-containing protein [Peptococcaceae bacterium]|nr:HDIG domain-containing protein [Peptococcaceae bacterium]